MKIKKVLSALFSIAFVTAMPAITASAESVQKDGLAISLTTDKAQYANGEEIQTKLSVTNNNSESVYEVELENLIPNGYKIASSSGKTQYLYELKAGETTELTSVIIKNGNVENSGQSADKVVPLSNGSRPEANPFSPTPANVSNVTPSGGSSSSSGDSTSNANTTAASSPTTSSSDVIPYVAAALGSAVLIVVTRKGKRKKLLSFVLFGSILLGMIPITDFRVDAIGDKTANITVNVSVDGKDVLLSAIVRYSTAENGELSVAEQYYKDNATILNSEKVSEDNTLSEQKAYTLLAEKGFSDFPITYMYSLSGEFLDEKITSNSSVIKHPMYGTYYISKNNEIWYVTVVGEDIFANPISFNMQTERDVPTMLSVSNSIIGYDDEKNRLYTIIPKETAMIVVKVEDINSEILDSLTVEEVGKL